MKYKIIEGSDYIGLTYFLQDVEDHLKRGWLIQGGVAVTQNSSGYKSYVQAMIFPNIS